jgi:energy-coupling factor transport system ATP-binding protein
VAILLATHDVELVAQVATRVTLLGDGRIVADGGPRTVLSGSLTFTTAVNKLYGDGFITPGDILAGLGISQDSNPVSERAENAPRGGDRS